MKKNSIGYWEDADWPLDFTTMDNTAEFTAGAAMDDSAPEKLVIASFRMTPNELKAVAEKTTGREFTMNPMGTRESLKEFTRKMRAENPAGEKEVFPGWQQSQYLLSMFTAKPVTLDNDRYGGINWTPAKEILASMS